MKISYLIWSVVLAFSICDVYYWQTHKNFKYPTNTCTAFAESHKPLVMIQSFPDGGALLCEKQADVVCYLVTSTFAYEMTRSDSLAGKYKSTSIGSCAFALPSGTDISMDIYKVEALEPKAN